MRRSARRLRGIADARAGRERGEDADAAVRIQRVAGREGRQLRTVDARDAVRAQDDEGVDLGSVLDEEQGRAGVLGASRHRVSSGHVRDQRSAERGPEYGPGTR